MRKISDVIDFIVAFLHVIRFPSRTAWGLVGVPIECWSIADSLPTLTRSLDRTTHVT